jgi:prepilin-type N-terminal cleavage/methylation domain-containing protein
VLIHNDKAQQGFTLVELVVSITLMAIIGTTFLVFFKSSLFDYLDLQSDATSLTELSSQEMRIATVVRGLTDVSSAGANDLSVYAYFYPSDAYVSLVHYYLQQNNGVEQLMADVTPMSANPPIGSLLTDQKRTYTVIDNFYQPSGGSLFTYLNSSGTALTLPVSDLTTIKGVQVNLATTLKDGGNQSVQVQVSLRNRKNNL